MRIFPPDYDHQSIARHMRREAMSGFQRGDDGATFRYVDRCSWGVNLLPSPRSVSLILTRDAVPDCISGWHLSVCCVTENSYRPYVPAEGEHWLGLIFGPYAERAAPRPLTERSPEGIRKDVRHFVIECDWTDWNDPAVSLKGVER